MSGKSLLPGEDPLTTFENLIRVRSTESKDSFTSFSKGIRAGNPQPVAYGGYVQALCVNAAAATLPEGFSHHGFQGTYLGPTSTTIPVRLVVQRLRSTRTFQTRLVHAYQRTSNSEERATFFAIVDFISAREPDSLIYYASPRLSYTPANQCPDYREHLAARVQQGTLKPEIYNTFLDSFSSFLPIFEQRFCPEGVGFQNLWGIDRTAKTSQDAVPMAAKSTAWWVKSKVAFTDHPDGSAMHKAALVFWLDAATSFIPLTHSHRFWDSTTACSSLDVSVRFRSSKFRADEWILIEMCTEGGGEGRTIAVGKAWNEDGELIATATQNCILRLKEGLAAARL